jgi:hypothetical protein
MTRSSNKQSEAYGFSRNYFPISWRGHKIILLENNGHVTVDRRLEIHINLHCKKCGSDSVVRWKFSDTYSEYNWAAALSKLLVLHGFSEECAGVEKNRRIP